MWDAFLVVKGQMLRKIENDRKLLPHPSFKGVRETVKEHGPEALPPPSSYSWEIFNLPGPWLPLL